MKAAEVKKASSEIDEGEEGGDNKEGAVASSHTRQTIGVKGPKVPCFDERSDGMDSFLHRFEVYADSQGWSKGQWAVYLSALLKGNAFKVYSWLSVKDVQDYEIQKDALLKRFNLTEEGSKHKFKSARAEAGEAPTQFIDRLENYLMRWIDLAIAEKDFDGLMNLIVREQYLESCLVQLAIFLRERKSKDLSELASLAEQYLDAHASNKKEWPRKPTFKGHLSPTSERKCERSGRSDRIVRPETGRECFNCGKTGHLVRDSEVAQKCTRCGKVGHTSRNCKLTPRCFNCEKVGHSTRNCFQPKRLAAMSHGQRNDGRGFRKEFQQSDQNSSYRNERVGSDSNEAIVKTIHEEVMVCIVYDTENCSECMRTAKKCHAMLASELTLECGCTLPVVAMLVNFLMRECLYA